MSMLPQRSPSSRRGFTLVELVVVIAIIAVLIALSAGAYIQLIASSRVSRTEEAVRTLDKVLHEQWNKVAKDAEKEEPISDAVLALGNNDPAIARRLWIKIRLAEAFPQSFAEIQNCFSTTSTVQTASLYGTDANGRQWIESGRRRYMAKYNDALKVMVAANHKAGTESGACLNLALSQDRGTGKLDQGNMSGSIGDTDGDGIKELIDNFGQPLRFQRFPIGTFADLTALNPRATDPKKARFGDPLDPDGKLQTPVVVNQIKGPTLNIPWCDPRNPSAVIFTTLVNHPFPANGFQPYWLPVIISNGRDEIAGNGDDIYSFKLRFGARGD
jgi:prepilin-type N-terminal cleavage/methylation domain-containing protein